MKSLLTATAGLLTLASAQAASLSCDGYITDQGASINASLSTAPVTLDATGKAEIARTSFKSRQSNASSVAYDQNFALEANTYPAPDQSNRQMVVLEFFNANDPNSVSVISSGLETTNMIVRYADSTFVKVSCAIKP